jgi:hypothetical protein
MKIPFVRSTNAAPHQLHSHTVRSMQACLLVLAPLLIIPVNDAFPSDSTIYSFGTQPRLDGAVPKGSLTYVTVNGLGLLFGRTTTTTPQSGDGIRMSATNRTAVLWWSVIFSMA